MDLFSLICAPNPTKVKTGSRPRAPHEVPLLTLTATRVIEMDEPAAATDSPGGTTAPEVPPPEDVPATAAPEVGQSEAAVAADPPVARESRKRGRDGIDATAPPKSLRKDHAGLRPSSSSHGGKSLAAMQLCMASNVFVSEGAPADVSDPDPLSFADAPSHHPVTVAQSSQGVAAAGDPKSENVSSPTEVGSPGSVYRPKWGVTNGSLLDTPEACQDLVDHAAPPGYFSELRHMHNEDFLRQYNINLARQVAMGSKLRLRFEQEAKLLQKSVAQVARRDQRIQARESEIKNLEALLETEAGMKRAAEEKSAGLSQELERMCAQFSELQAAFKEYKRQQDQMVEQRWVIGHGLRLAMMKCAESLEMRQSFADMEGLKDAPMDVIMAALYLESDTGGDASQFIRDLRPSLVKNKREKDKIRTKPDKNGKRGKAGKSQEQSQSVEQEKLNKTQKEGPKMHTQSKRIKA
nr:hypothetical protein [Tanacetum cinerariifolium]